MTREDVIRMAQEAELNAHGLVIDRLERFAALVAAHFEYIPGPVQVPVAEFVEMVLEKEHLVGKPLVWAQWPNEEQK
jgi:hypothetical protein